MRSFVKAILALGTLAVAGANPVLAAAAPGPGTKAAISSTSQVEKVHGRHGGFGRGYGGFGRGFGGYGLYVGPRWGGYYGSPYYSYDSYAYDDDDYYSGPSYYYPSYGYRRFGHRGGYGRHYGNRRAFYRGGRGRRH